MKTKDATSTGIYIRPTYNLWIAFMAINYMQQHFYQL